MQLEELVGLHELSAVDEGVLEESGYAGTPNAIWFTLDGKTYQVSENPSDGYRSCMRDIVQSDRIMTNTFLPVQVLGRYLSGSEDILELIDVQTGKSVLRVGTHDQDDYYPSYVSEFYPHNMAINAGR